MSLTVLSVAYPFAPVGPDAVGGAEQVLGYLDRALQRLGHRSIVVACDGSKPAGTLIATPGVRQTLTEAQRRETRSQHLRNIEQALEQFEVDLIHMHGIDFYHYLPPPGLPVIVTLHLPPSWYPEEIFRLARPDTWFHCVSRAQRRTCPDSPLLLPEIENGVAVESLQIQCKKRNYALA